MSLGDWETRSVKMNDALRDKYKEAKIKEPKKQGGSGPRAVYYTSPQILMVTFFLFVGLTILGTLLNFNWLAYLVECPNVSTTDQQSE